MNTPKEVKITKAKGRPMLQWVGKKPLTTLPAYPAQHIESFGRSGLQPATVADPSRAEARSYAADWKDWPDKYPQGGLLFHGDNKDVLAHLLANGFRGKVKLVYIDPPFDSGADYVRKIKLRGHEKIKLDGEEYGLEEQVQYTDIWANDNYLQFMFERLLLIRELLSDNGSLFLHCDSSKSHYIRCILDEVFGAEKSFKNEIIWAYRRWPSNSPAFQAMHDNIFWYTKSNDNSHTFHKTYEDASESYLKRFGGKTQILDNEAGTRKITSEEETKGMPTRDVWDISILAGFKGERTDYPTQKPEILIDRIISSCSNAGDIILDCFIGSGTTATVAQKLGRRWIGCDINKGAIQTTAKRLQTIITEQAQAAEDDRQGSLLEDDETTPPKPAQLGFSVWRVNDYDLHIQHNEAVELVAEYLGIQRVKSDGFFDGTRGKYLVKINPFNHPLTPLDLDAIKAELNSRPGEERDVQIVTLGMELAAKAWLEQHNRNRPINRFHVIELRTDKKYGGIIKHEPATAEVSVSREILHGKEVLKVEILDVVSPAIIQRLNLDTSLFRAQIPEWRSVVDCVLIDAAYDGQVFNVCLSDVPERKQDLVLGRYELPAPPPGSTVAVKIIDMLGEEIVVVKGV